MGEPPTVGAFSGRITNARSWMARAAVDMPAMPPPELEVDAVVSRLRTRPAALARRHRDRVEARQHLVTGVHDEFEPGDVGGLVRGQVQHRVGGLLRVDHPAALEAVPHRGALVEELECSEALASRHEVEHPRPLDDVRVDDTGQDGVDADAVGRAELLSIVLNAADPSALGKAISDATAKGVQFVTCCSLAKQGQDVLFNTGTPEQNAPIGNILASKVVADSNGKADTVYVNVSAFAILAAVGTEFEKKYKQYCPDCKFGKIDIPLTSLGKDASDRIVSYLRSHPSVNYVVLSESGSLSAGLPAALQAAGLGSKVKVIGQGGNQQTYQDVKSGKIVGVTPSSLYGYDYSMFDALARKWAGQEVLETTPEFWFMTSSLVPPAATAGPAFPIVQDYQAQWAKLWGKSPAS
jgi:ABC-type sugar transport system substrate-binding protein